MAKIAFPLTLLATALACSLLAVPAQAQTRTYTAVAAATLVGAVPNPQCGSLQSPCQTLQLAFNVTAENGVIDVLDPGEYGPVTITHGVTIQGHGWTSVTAASRATAITINAGVNENITIRGVLLDGVGGRGFDGISFRGGGGRLTIQDSVIRSFGIYGIDFESSASSLTALAVSNTLLADNEINGIFIGPIGTETVVGVLDHVEMLGNAVGLLVDDADTSTINVTVSDSVSANSTLNGITVLSSNGAATNIMVRNSTIENNTDTGLTTDGSGVQILVTRSTITGNATGWSAIGGASVTSYGDNNVFGNVTNGSPTSTMGYQ